MTTTPRVFISFDFDHDEDLRNALVGQARNENSPFDFSNWSLKEAFTGDWKKKIKERIDLTSRTIVICGYTTHTAAGISEELKIVRELGKPYLLLNGRKDGRCTKPAAAHPTDQIIPWTWPNIQRFLQARK